MRKIQSLQLLKNKGGDIYIVPYVLNELGLYNELDSPIKISKGTDPETIGHLVKKYSEEVIQIDKLNSKDKVLVWQNISGIKSREKFCAEWERVGTSFNPSKEKIYGVSSGYTVDVDKFDGEDFLGTTFMPKYELPLDVTDQELGETILKAFSQIAGIELDIFDRRKNK